MNLNNKTNKLTAVVVPLVLIGLFSMVFAILERTPILITAYVTAIISSLLFLLGNFYFIGSQKSYPWVAAIPMTLWRYIITSTLLSAVFVIADNVIPAFDLPVMILIIGQVIIFSFYLVMLLVMHSGKEYIEQLDEKVAVKRQFIKELSADLASIKESAPNDVKKLSGNNMSKFTEVFLFDNKKKNAGILDVFRVFSPQLAGKNTR